MIYLMLDEMQTGSAAVSELEMDSAYRGMDRSAVVWLDPVTGPHQNTDDIDPSELPPFRFPSEQKRQFCETGVAAAKNPNRTGYETPRHGWLGCLRFFAGLRQRPEDVLTTAFDIAHDELNGAGIEL